MHELIFFVLFAILVFGLIKAKSLADFFQYNLNIPMNINILRSILIIFLVLLIVAGMLLDNTKEKYSHISDGYQKFVPKEDKRPHRYFDVNTYD